MCLEVGEQEGKFNILVGSQDGDEIIELEDKADGAVTPFAEVLFGNGIYLPAFYKDASRCGVVNCGDDVEEGCFS